LTDYDEKHLEAEALNLAESVRKSTHKRIMVPVHHSFDDEQRAILARVFAAEGVDIERVTFQRLPTPVEAARNEAELRAIWAKEYRERPRWSRLLDRFRAAWAALLGKGD